jgi:hypothetical protein
MLYALRQKPVHRVNRDSMAHMQFVRRIILLLPILPGKIVAILKVFNPMDSQGDENSRGAYGV